MKLNSFLLQSKNLLQTAFLFSLVKKTQVENTSDYKDEHSLLKWFRCQLHCPDIYKDKTIFALENMQLSVLNEIDEKALIDIRPGCMSRKGQIWA